MRRNHICIISFSNIGWDSRVLRQIETARKQYTVTVIGLGDWAGEKNVEFISIKKSNVFPPIKYILLVLGKISPVFYEIYYSLKKHYSTTYKIIASRSFEVIHANEWDTLPIAIRYSKNQNCRIVFDAHEFYLSRRKNDWIFNNLIYPYVFYFLKKYGSAANAKITVSDGIAQLYRKIFGWQMKTILNAPAYIKVDTHRVIKDEIKLIHHGGALPARKIEDLIQLITKLDKRFSLYLMLIPSSKSYYRKIVDLAFQTDQNRIFFIDPVPPDKIIQTISQFDIGIHLLPGDRDNHLYALPNKFFDFMMAGLTLCVYPLPMMAEMIRMHHIGIVSNDENILSVASALNSISQEEVIEYKKNSIKLSKTINAEREMGKLAILYKVFS